MLKSQKKIYFLALIFIVPMVISWMMFHFHEYFQFKTMNHGNLVTPSINATALFKQSKKVWHIVHVDNGTCDAQCEKLRYQLSQVIKALGKNYNRVEFTLLNANSPEFKTLTEQNKKLAGNQVYLVDPLGNLFMYYANEINPMDVLKDLKRVLEVSQIG